MECTKCRITKPLTDYSFKNIKEKIYYLYCNECRKKTLEIQKKYKDEAKLGYEIKKITDNIECECGKSFVSFRSFHMERHMNSKFHQIYMEKIKNSK